MNKKKIVSLFIIFLLLIGAFFLGNMKIFSFSNFHGKSKNTGIEYNNNKCTEYQKSETLQEKWENDQGKTNSIIFIGGEDNTNELGKKVIDARYSTKEYQKALFKNESLYFHFTQGKFAKNAEITLYIYTGTINFTFENLDNSALTKTINFPAFTEKKKKTFTFEDYGMLGNGGDIHTIKIWTDSDLAILDYNIRILEK